MERDEARVHCHGVAIYSSWEIWSLRCDHCRWWCAGELAEVAQEMQPLTAWFCGLCNCEAVPWYQHPSNMSPQPGPLLCCREGQPAQHIHSPPTGAGWEASLLLMRVEGDGEIHPCIPGYVPPVLASSQDYPKQVSSYFSGHLSGCLWLFDLTLWIQRSIYRAGCVQEESDSEYSLGLLS